MRLAVVVRSRVRKMAGVLCWRKTRGSAIVSFYQQQVTPGYLTVQDDLSRGDEAAYGKQRMHSERSMMTEERK